MSTLADTAAAYAAAPLYRTIRVDSAEYLSTLEWCGHIWAGWEFIPRPNFPVAQLLRITKGLT